MMLPVDLRRSCRPLLGALLLLTAVPATSWADPAALAQLAASRAAEAGAANRRVVTGAAPGWLFLASELKHVGTGEFWNQPEAMPGGDPAAAIIAYHEALKALGVTLVVVPVPAKAAIYPDKLASDQPAEAAFPSAPFFEKLTAAGVTAVDLEPVFRQERAEQKVCCEQDSHWTPGACRLTAEVLCALPAVRDLLPPQDVVPRAGEEIRITGDLVEGLGSEAPDKETLTVFKAAAQPVPPDEASPVILVGDSHTVVFSEAGGTIRNHTTGAGLRDHLQVRLGLPLAVVTTAASGGDGARGLLARKAAATPDFWKNRKLVIWCFSAREFTQGRWRLIPPLPGK
jgi:alginate O-acetyltransferase complex protein AlgJ